MFRKLGNFLKKGTGRRLNVFLVCLFISSIIWLLIALSKSYSTRVELPVEHLEIPDDRIPEGEWPERLTVQVHSHGFQLLYYKLFSRQNPLRVELSKLRYKDPEERLQAFLPTRRIQEDLTQQFPEKTEIRGIDPDTLFFGFTPRVEKEMTVKPQLDLELREQFRIEGQVEVEPPTVSISGPGSVLDTLNAVRTELLEIEDLYQDRTETVSLALDQFGKEVRADPEKVKLRIKVDEFTEGSIRIPLQVDSIPKGRTVKTYPDSITVHYLVGFQNYEKVKPEMFETVAELPSKERLREEEELPVELRDQPSFVDIVRYEPRNVEFIIRKKE